jgi:hypothetical protein
VVHTKAAHHREQNDKNPDLCHRGGTCVGVDVRSVGEHSPRRDGAVVLIKLQPTLRFHLPKSENHTEESHPHRA